MKWRLLCFTLVIIAVLLTVAVSGQNTIQNWNQDFFWDDPGNVAGTVTYNLYKSGTPGPPYTKVNVLPIIVKTFNDPTAVEGECFAVSAVAQGGIETLSDELCIVSPAKPILLRLFQVIVSFLRDLFSWWG